MEYNIVLTEIEDLALGSVAFSPKEWIENAAKERARLAIEDIIQLVVKKCLEESIPIPSTREEMVHLAFEKKWVVLLSSINNNVNLPLE